MKNTLSKLLCVTACAVALFLMPASLSAQTSKKQTKAAETMKTATRYMMEHVSYHGGFVWNYLPDLSRSWGEMEARRTMVWLQSPGTPLVGQLLLDAYHATGDEYYYECAKQVADILVWGQEPCGGWNYMFDLAGEGSLKEWYATIGKSGWRLEEFQHYYGNATFDDSVTSDVAKFLLRLYVEKYDPTYRPALDKVIDFVLQSQYPIGGWPQRYPLHYDHVFRGKTDYSSFLTLNDDVIPDNIDFLVQCYQALGLKSVKGPIMRALNLAIILQQGEPYAGWADQYTVDDLQPAHARSYEPRSVNTGTTAMMIRKMCDYYRLTGETKFLSGIPAALRFLESMRLPDSEVARFGLRRPLEEGQFAVPRFIDPESGKPLYVHRRGSNAANGYYYTDQDISGTIAHYSSIAVVDVAALRRLYEETKALSREEATKESPLLRTELTPLPEYYVPVRPPRRGGKMPDADEVIRSLTSEGCWLTPLTSVSNPYRPLPEAAQSEETRYAGTFVGDEYDTSCYPPEEEVMGISTQVYVSNMSTLIQYLLKKDEK